MVICQYRTLKTTLCNQISEVDDRVPQSSLGSVAFCGTAVEVHGNTSDTTATKDSLKVAAGCNRQENIWGKQATEYHGIEKCTTYTAKLQDLSRDTETRWRTTQGTKRTISHIKLGSVN